RRGWAFPALSAGRIRARRPAVAGVLAAPPDAGRSVSIRRPMKSPALKVSAGIHWVRGELEQSIARARVLIDTCAESGGSPLQLQQAYVELQQVRGTAAIIQCYGMAAAAAEMAAAVHDLIQGQVSDQEPLYAALLGATIQLTDYVQAL